MRNCRVCGFECKDNAEFCPNCGAELDAVTEEKADIIIKDPVLAASVENMITADIYKDVLAENGILFSAEEKEGIHLRFGGGMSACEIFVSKSDLEAAQLLYDAVLKTEDFEEEEN
mgnify:CR=1 FL=1